LTFIPLSHYMVESQVPAVLREANRRLIIHTVITGGQALADTVMGFKSLAEGCETRSIIVWINEYFGPVEKLRTTGGSSTSWEHTWSIRTKSREPVRSRA